MVLTLPCGVIGGDMTDQPSPAPAEEPLAQQYPLLPEDPVKVGDFWLDARLTATNAGTAFTAHEEDGDSVMLILLAEGAAQDHAARARFSGEVNAMHIDTVVGRGGQGQDEGRLGVRFRPEDDDPNLAGQAPLAPWVALAFSGTFGAIEEANRILHGVDLEMTSPLGEPSGPDYRLHWDSQTAHGTTRLWPLPWPGRRDRAGWITFLTSWLLMLLLAALAILLAILLFQNAPLTSPPPPVPSEGETGEGSSGEESGEPQEPETGEGSPEESPGDAPHQDPTDSPSMEQPGEGDTGPGDPSPNRRL